MVYLKRILLILIFILFVVLWFILSPLEIPILFGSLLCCPFVYIIKGEAFPFLDFVITYLFMWPGYALFKIEEYLFKE